MDHNKLMHTTFIMDGDHVFATSDNGATVTLAFTRESVAPEFFNILRAALLLYQTSDHTARLIDNLIELAEKAGADMLVPQLLNANAVHVAVKRVAVDGVEALISDMLKNSGTTH